MVFFAKGICSPAFSAIIGCQLNLLILFNNAWLSNLHYQLEVSINSKKRRPFPGYYRREFPKTFLRVFVKYKETFFFRFFFKFVVNADGFLRTRDWILFPVNTADSPEHRNDFFGVFLGDLFIFMDWSETYYIFQEKFPVERTLFFPV